MNEIEPGRVDVSVIIPTYNRNARLLALRDAMLRRWGLMGPAVAQICYPNR